MSAASAGWISNVDLKENPWCALLVNKIFPILVFVLACKWFWKLPAIWLSGRAGSSEFGTPDIPLVGLMTEWIAGALGAPCVLAPMNAT